MIDFLKYWATPLICLFSGISVPHFAYAQTSIFDIPEDEQDTFADIGIAALTRETYIGSDESELRVLPYINARYKGRYFINPALGVGAYAIRNENFRLAGSLNFSLGRDGEDTPLDNEILDVDAGFAGVISSRIYTPFAAIDIIGNVPLTGDLDGFRVDTLVTTEFFPFENLRVTPGVRATYHSSDFLDAQYGITQDQLTELNLPATSNITPLEFGSEISTLGAHFAAYLTLNKDYEIVGIVNYSRLVGDVEDTTLAPSNDGITAAIALTRTF